MTWFRVGGAGIPASLKNNMNSVLNKKFGTTGQNYPPNGWPADVNLLGPLPEKTVAGAIAHTDDAADTVPVKSVICSIVPKQSGSGTPSPTNVRALSGYTGLTIIQLGKNILNINASIEEPNPTSLNVSPRILEDFKWYKGLRSDNYYYPNYITYSVGSGSITVTNSNSSNAYGMSYCFPIRPGEVFTVSLVCDSSPLFSVGYFDENWNFVGTSSSSYQVTSQTITAPSEAYHAILTLRAPQNTPKTYSSVQIEFGSSATSYEQYITPEIKSDSWSSIGAIQVGERDLTKGTLKKTYELIELKVSDMDNSENYPGWRNSGVRALGISSGYYTSWLNIGSGFSVNVNYSNDILFLPTGDYGMTQSQWMQIIQI